MTTRSRGRGRRLHIVRRLAGGARRNWGHNMIDTTILQFDDGFFAGHGFDFAAQFLAEKIAIITHGFGNKIQRPELHGLEGGFSAAFRQGADHNHRQGISLHQLLQCGQAVEAGHFHIQGHDIDVEFLGFLESFLPVAGNSRNFDFRVLFQQGNKSIAHKS